MGYYIAEYKNEIWTLGKEYFDINKVLDQYKLCVHLYGTTNIKLLMKRSVHMEIEDAILSHPLPHEKIVI